MDFKLFGSSPFKRFRHGKSFKSLKDSCALPAPGGKYTVTKDAGNGLEGKYASSGGPSKFPTPGVKQHRAGYHKSRTLPNMGKKACHAGTGAPALHRLHIGDKPSATGSKVTLGESGLKHRWASRGNDLGKTIRMWTGRCRVS